jgi:hypothetical protein
MSTSDNDGRTTSFTFSIGPGDELRTVHDDAVVALDEALEAVGTGGVNHFIDPQRLKSFRSGGPSVWSVATVPTEGGTLYLTYGFGEAIDPARAGCDFEMSVLVPGAPAMWYGANNDNALVDETGAPVAVPHVAGSAAGGSIRRTGAAPTWEAAAVPTPNVCTPF